MIEKLKQRFPTFAKVYALAESDRGHGKQFRNDRKTPYMRHIDAVILGTFENIYPLDKFNKFEETPPWIESFLIVAALHDSLEDTLITEEEIREIVKGYAENIIVQAIKNITKLPKGQEKYINYLERVNSSYLSKQVKISDLNHNMSDLSAGNLLDKYSVSLWFLQNIGTGEFYKSK